MNRETLQDTVPGRHSLPGDGACEALRPASSRRLAWRAWLARTAAITFLVGGGIVSYLFFTAL